MKSIDSHLSALKFPTLEFKSVHESGTLFEPDMRLAVRGICPLCNCRLYLMRNRPYYFCKSVKHIKKFIISADKVKVR